LVNHAIARKGVDRKTNTHENLSRKDATLGEPTLGRWSLEAGDIDAELLELEVLGIGIGRRSGDGEGEGEPAFARGGGGGGGDRLPQIFRSDEEEEERR
jgi:hypothetical protein